MSTPAEPRSDRPSPTNAALGRLVAMIAGKRSVDRGSSPLDGAVGELLSWIAGRDDSRTTRRGR